MMKCRDISQTRNNHSDIRMTKTRWRAGDGGTAQVLCSEQRSGAGSHAFMKKDQSQVLHGKPPERSRGGHQVAKMDLSPHPLSETVQAAKKDREDRSSDQHLQTDKSASQAANRNTKEFKSKCGSSPQIRSHGCWMSTVLVVTWTASSSFGSLRRVDLRVLLPL